MIMFLLFTRWIREQQELIGQTSSVLVQRVDRDWHGSRVECEATNKVTSTRQSVSLNVECKQINIRNLIVSPVRSTYGGYYGLVVVTPPPPPRPPRPQTLHRSHDNLKNPYRIASIFYM